MHIFFQHPDLSTLVNEPGACYYSSDTRLTQTLLPVRRLNQISPGIAL